MVGRSRISPRAQRPTGSQSVPIRRPWVVTIVLNYRGAADTIAAVRSVQGSEYLDQEILVVDNSAVDDEHRALAQSLGPQITTVATGHNLGFAGGNNIGINWALERKPEFVWILNSDTQVEPTTLTNLLRGAEAVPDAGVIGARITRGNGSGAPIWFDGGKFVQRRSGAPVHLNYGKLPAEVPAPAQPYEVGYVTGACMLLRSLAIRDVGLLPEEYFLYFEESDYAKRLQLAGWRTIVDARAKMSHAVRSQLVVPSNAYIYYMIRNRIIFSSRWFGASTDTIVSDLNERFIASRRATVAANKPELLPAFERLVSIALEDGCSGRLGPRTDLDQ